MSFVKLTKEIFLFYIEHFGFNCVLTVWGKRTVIKRSM